MPRTGVVAARREHLDALCVEHEVACEYQPAGVSRASAFPAERRVLIPRTTMVRSYYLGLHEVAHCVLGYDHDRPAAPQEAQAWGWAIEQAIEPPTPGLQRMIFKALWHYLLSDMTVSGAAERSNRDLFPAPGDAFWGLLAGLDDDPGRLLYEAAKITARVGPSTKWAAEANMRLLEEQRRGEQAVQAARAQGKRALVREQIRLYGPPTPAHVGELVLLGAGQTAHRWRREGQYATFTQAVFCGASGVAHKAPSDALVCRSCERLWATNPGGW